LLFEYGIAMKNVLCLGKNRHGIFSGY